MMYLHASQSSSLQDVEFSVDDDIYEKYKNHKFRYAVCGAYGNRYIQVRCPSTGKYANFARSLLGIEDRNSYTEYIDGSPLNLQRSNLQTISRGDLNRRRHPKHYGRKFKGTLYTDSIWYSVVYLPDNKKFIRRCSDEAEAALVYDATLDYLDLEGYRNFPKQKKSYLTKEDIRLINQKINPNVRLAG